MNYEEAVEHFKNEERPSIDAFINFAKGGFVLLEMMYGAGWVLQAIEIAEQLKKASEK
jgi:hypothetical protein